MDAELIDVLTAVRELLELCDEREWSKTFGYFGERARRDSVGLKREIRLIYAGMGSFSDLVVYREGHLERGLNEKLDSLRHRLYELCR